MIDWIKTAQGVAAIIAAVFASMVAWWNLGLPRLVFSPERMTDTRPIDLNSDAWDRRHVSGLADPFNGHIDEFRIAQRPAFRRLDRDHLEQHEQPRCVRSGRGRGAGRRRAAADRGCWCGRLPDGVRVCVRGEDKIAKLRDIGTSSHLPRPLPSRPPPQPPQYLQAEPLRCAGEVASAGGLKLASPANSETGSL